MKKNSTKLWSLILALFLVLSLTPLTSLAAAETLTIQPNTTSGTVNCFQYHAYQGKNWVSGAAEAYIDLGASNANAEQCYYEVPFAGSGIKVFANKSHNHGKVKYTIDGGHEQIVDLYNSSRTNPQAVYTVTGLSEGTHVLKAVTQSTKNAGSSAIVNQVAYVEVTHEPYEVTDITLAVSSLSMKEGQTHTLSYTITPSYASAAGLTFASSNANVAVVSDAGVITAKAAGSAVITVSNTAKTFSKTVNVSVTEAVPGMGGAVGDTNTQYTQNRYAEVSAKHTRNVSVSAWKNDKSISEIVLFSEDSSLKNVSVTASDFTDGTHTIPSDCVTATFLKSVKAFNGGNANNQNVTETATNRTECSDVLYQTSPIDVPYNSLQPVWVEIAVPKDAAAGTYTGKLTATADGIAAPLEFTYTLEVQDAVLPDADAFGSTFDIELWQYPYTSAEYYNVTPFSEEHKKIMESSMLKYKEIGGHAITATISEEAWNGQTYSKNAVHYPSMVKWTKNADGSFTYDYTDFDKWVTFCKSLGIGDKIVLYSIAPWHNSFTYWENGTLKYEGFTAGNDRYNKVWGDFLRDMAAHLTEKGWFDDAYIGIDERGFSKAAFDLIDSIQNSEGKTFKTAGAMDSFVSKKDLAMRVDDLNVGDTAAQASLTEFNQLLADREAQGLRTTLYSCTGHKPGNFSVSAPAECYWSLVNAGKNETAGFLRWAYDAWVEDPLRDTTHTMFEPGDCFLIYPDEKNAAEPKSKSSVRLEKMAEGVRDVNKLRMIEAEVPTLADDIAALYADIRTAATHGTYLNDAQITQVVNEMTAFKAGVAEITKKYVAFKNSGDFTDEIEAVAIKEGASATVSAGNTLQLHAEFTPANVLNTKVKWTSSNDAVATVSNAGLVTGQKIGTAVITAVSVKDITKSASITVTVRGVEIDQNAQVAYYSFDTMDNNVIKDEWGSRNGTSQGAKLAKGRSGQALEITEAEKSAVLNGSAGLGDTWTVAYWVCGTASGTRSSVLMDSSKRNSFDTRLADDREKAGFHTGTGAGDVLTYNYIYPVGSWVHMAWTQNKQNGLSLYVNGALIETNVWTKTNAFQCPVDIIGGTGFTGKIDELKIYNKALNAAEVASCMQTKGLNLSETYKELNIGDTWQIVTNLDSDEADKTITYVSADPSIASVDAKGNVTAKKRGDTVITVENAAGGYKEEVQIHVTKILYLQSRIPMYQLNEKYLSDVDKDETGERGRRYLGQPDMIMLDDNKTLITVYPKGHGIGSLVMRISYDAGETWADYEHMPESWSRSRETPTIYKLNMSDGTTKLILICGRPSWGDNTVTGGWDTSISTDNGETWSEYQTFHPTYNNGQQNYSVVAMASLIQLKDAQGNFIDKWMGVYHDLNYVNYKTYLTFDENGNEQWTAPEPYLSEYRSIESSRQMCEVGLFRSPDGKRIVGMARSQSHNHLSTMFYSDDEGETWSEPTDMQGSLAGERHKALYDPISGKIMVTFREIQYDQNGNNQFDGGNDWMAGDWVAWIGTYEDIMEQGEGEYRILLCEDWANNRYSGDTGYTGMVVQPDGTFILDTYGHWDKAISSTQTNVHADLCWIKQAKFNLSAWEVETGIAAKRELNQVIEEAAAITDASQYTEESWAALQTALRNAENALASGTKEQQEAAKEALRKALDALAKKIPAEVTEAAAKLQREANAAKQIQSADYTAESWAAFRTALADAESVLNNPAASLEMLQKALDALQKAQSALVKQQGQGEEPLPNVGSTFVYKNAVYKVTKSAAVNGTAVFVRPVKKTNKKVTVPAVAKWKNVSFKVTEIAPKAMKGNKKLTKIIIGKNVTKIGKSAFAGAKKLKLIRVKTKVLKSVGGKAFKGVHAKCKIKVPKKKLKAYRKLMKKKGQKASVKITK